MLICCFGSVLIARAEEDFDFRKARWGMTIEEIQKTETAHFFEKDIKKGILIYTEKLLDEECAIVYNFKKGKLTHCNYLFFNIEDENSKLMFNTIDKQLSKKYTKEENPSSHLKIIEIYNNDRSHIVLASLKSEKGGRNIAVTYKEKNFYQDECDEENKKRMDDEKRRKKDLEMF